MVYYAEVTCKPPVKNSDLGQSKTMINQSENNHGKSEGEKTAPDHHSFYLYR